MHAFTFVLHFALPYGQLDLFTVTESLLHFRSSYRNSRVHIDAPSSHGLLGQSLSIDLATDYSIGLPTYTVFLDCSPTWSFGLSTTPRHHICPTCMSPHCMD